jgi:hypothetical protein
MVLHSRLLFLSRQVVLGMYIPLVKRQALLTADLSHKRIHPFFVHFAHLVGCQLYQELRGQYILLSIQAVHLRLTLDVLEKMVEEEDPFIFAQANFYVGIAHAYGINAYREAKRYCQTAVQVFRRNNIRFVSVSTGHDVESKREDLEELHERTVFLGHMLYLETHVYLIGQPSATMEFEIGEDFKVELPVHSIFLIHLRPSDDRFFVYRSYILSSISTSISRSRFHKSLNHSSDMSFLFVTLSLVSCATLSASVSRMHIPSYSRFLQFHFASGVLYLLKMPAT